MKAEIVEDKLKKSYKKEIDSWQIMEEIKTHEVKIFQINDEIKEAEVKKIQIKEKMLNFTN
jgi:hypothetical protein